MKTLISVLAVAVLTTAPAIAQKGSGSSATSVSAEMTRGKLNPAESKPGDKVMLKLNGDVKSNGEVVLKKGTTITGVIRNVHRNDGKPDVSNNAQSMLEVEWFAPESQGRSSQQLSVALQSVIQVSPLYASRQESDSDWESAKSSAAGAPVHSGGSLLGATNVALLSMPSVVAADAQTASSLQSDLGVSAGHPLFQTGHGQVVSAQGAKQSLDIFSHMNNDTVLTSRSKNFEISSGAQMQLLVGMLKN